MYLYTFRCMCIKRYIYVCINAHVLLAMAIQLPQFLQPLGWVSTPNRSHGTHQLILLLLLLLVLLLLLLLLLLFKLVLLLLLLLTLLLLLPQTVAGQAKDAWMHCSMHVWMCANMHVCMYACMHAMVLWCYDVVVLKPHVVSSYKIKRVWSRPIHMLKHSTRGIDL